MYKPRYLPESVGSVLLSLADLRRPSMRPFSSLALGALTLAWLVGPVFADDPGYSKMPATTTETANSQPAVTPQECGPKCAENCGPCCGNEAECGHFVGAV